MERREHKNTILEDITVEEARKMLEAAGEDADPEMAQQFADDYNETVAMQRELETRTWF